MQQQNQFDDEMKRMDELESEQSSLIEKGVALDDPISSLSLPDPIVVESNTSLANAITQLQDRSLGCLLIEKDGKLAGIMTERDILLKITGKGLDFEKEVVDSFITPDPEYLKMEDDVAYALNKMVISGFRHVPIVDDKKRSIGVVSLVDIVQQVANSLGEEILNLPPIPQRKGFSRPEGG